MNEIIDNETCIYSTLLYVQSQADKLNIPTPCITFDQALWTKAVEIIDAKSLNIVCRLGGFLIMMSFLGSIGSLMEGSGLSDLFDTVYGVNAVTHMMSGKDVYGVNAVTHMMSGKAVYGVNAVTHMMSGKDVYGVNAVTHMMSGKDVYGVNAVTHMMSGKAVYGVNAVTHMMSGKDVYGVNAVTHMMSGKDVYGVNAVTHMVSGKAVSRATRGHF